MNIMISGDFCSNARFIIGEANLRNSVSSEVASISKVSDFSIANLECPILLQNKVRRRMVKQGHNLAYDNSTFDYVKSIGFDAITLANNHMNEYGSEGIFITVSKAKVIGLDYVGVGINKTSSRDFTLQPSKQQYAIGHLLLRE